MGRVRDVALRGPCGDRDHTTRTMRGSVVPVSTTGGAGQPSYTVRTVGPDLAVFPGYSLGVIQ